MQSDVVTRTEFADLKLLSRGKVRDIYEVDGGILLVATDRISAFDCVLPNGIPNKGRVLTALSEFWFERMKDIVPNHVITTDVDEYPPSTAPLNSVTASPSPIKTHWPPTGRPRNITSITPACGMNRRWAAGSPLSPLCAIYWTPTTPSCVWKGS